ncbi:MAG: hypothetical protein EP329_09325 [Deltaproteobacteria bacterium]|nr:MAG: hypothetical protein EP329_09325 [Deltaproteobacteria bacterium]
MSRVFLPAPAPTERTRGRRSFRPVCAAALLAFLALPACLNLEPLPPVGVVEGVDTVTDALAADATDEDESAITVLDDATATEEDSTALGL